MRRRCQRDGRKKGEASKRRIPRSGVRGPLNTHAHTHEQVEAEGGEEGGGGEGRGGAVEQ